MSKFFKFLSLIFVLMMFSVINVSAKGRTYYVDIELSKISTDNKSYDDIVKYNSLDEFLSDYNSNKLPDIYITMFLFDGVSSVKSPDLDDFIESSDNNTKIEELSIEVLNINTLGDIELTGTKKGMMVAVNTNEKKGDINIILNNVNIDTDTKKSPVMYIYNKDITYTECNVTIDAKKGTKNYLEGGKFKKVSLIPREELDSYQKYYSGNNLTNFNKYSSYYGIYTKEEIENILFATVKADNEGLNDGDPYLFYKGSGAITSDIDLNFLGEGFLSIISKNKEGVETKGNLTFKGGVGDYEILAHDDCLNTTTSSSVGKNVRNSLVIDVNSLKAIVDDEGDEGDAIDSNGTLTINGGVIYAFAHSNSGDAGLDSNDGTIINGGVIIATGNMTDMISVESSKKYIYVNFNSKIDKDTLIVIKDQDDKIITAFKTSKDIKTLLYSDEDLDYKSFKIYSGGTIDGVIEDGLYTKINSYEDGVELDYNEVSTFMNRNSHNNTFILRLLIAEIFCLVIVIVYAIYCFNLKSKS